MFLSVKMDFRFIVLFLILWNLGCRPDSKGAHLLPEDAGMEDVYFADYESPEKKWGYIDTSGSVVIELKYDEVRDFNDGLASVNFQGKWGFIDRAGLVIIDYQYMFTQDFSEGKALVQDFSENKYFISKNGTKLFECLYDDCRPFSHGKSKVEKNGLLGYIDSKGVVGISPVLSNASDFKDGYAVVNITGKPELFDLNFSTIPVPEFDELYLPQNEMIRFKKDKKYGFYDLRTRQMFKDMFDRASDFYGNFAAVKQGEQNYILDKSMKKTPIEAQQITPGGPDFWLYNNDGKFGFLYPDGKISVEAQYELLYRFSDGLAGFMVGGFWGYIDTSGSQIVPPVLPLIWDYRNGFCRFISREGIGFLDKRGQIAIRPRFYEVRDFSEGLARVQQN